MDASSVQNGRAEDWVLIVLITFAHKVSLWVLLNEGVFLDG